MPKISRTSYWFEFKLECKYSKNIHQQIARAGAQAAQWCCVDDYILGYLFFQHHRALPLKKQWISCAEFTPSTSEKIKDNYYYLSVTFNSFGDNLLFSAEHVGQEKKSIQFLSKNNDMPALPASLEAVEEDDVAEPDINYPNYSDELLLLGAPYKNDDGFIHLPIGGGDIHKISLSNFMIICSDTLALELEAISGAEKDALIADMNLFNSVLKQKTMNYHEE